MIRAHTRREAGKAAVRDALVEGRITMADVDEALNIYHEAADAWEHISGPVGRVVERVKRARGQADG